ncbi:hypothetical protein M9H77_12244 [Catharanthus roseus]|uniref:Uncharacterized protein n=1 Tax=Catharanthus roseus TaxID=4058 RepID=A0ACC0BGX6_CATRO|nr:hypothetical protein M9H77_12244 [Catharanthus roseus]
MYRLHLFSRAATHISAIMQDRFTNFYHHGSELPGCLRHVLRRMCMGPDTIHDQDETCMVGQGRQLDERFAYRCSDSMERFSKSRHLEELHKHQTGDKKGQYVDFYLEEFWAQQKTEKEIIATGVPMPDVLQLMAIIFG